MHDPIRQIAYCVPDPRAAAETHSRMYGSGPFFLAEHVPVENFRYRGNPGNFDHTTCFGQWGEIMLEFFQQHNNEPSQGHDMFPFGSGKSGIHHVALIVHHLEKSVLAFRSLNFEVASRFRMKDSFEVVFVDTRSLYGHMVELYSGKEVSDIYDMVKNAARSWDMKEIVRSISL